MIHYRSPLEIELIRKSALLVGDALAEAAKMLKAGVTTMQVDTRMEQFIRDNGAVPSFKNYQGTYPFATCISVNDAVVHGFPTNNVLKDGDIVSVDVGVFMNGYSPAVVNNLYRRHRIRIKVASGFVTREGGRLAFARLTGTSPI